MLVKPTISEKDFVQILANYDLGEYKSFKMFAHGDVQTTVLLLTSHGKFVLRYYEKRPEKHMLFEVRLLNYLHAQGYPVPRIINNISSGLWGTYKTKPYMIIAYINGEHAKNPNDFFDGKLVAKVIKTVANLHNLTKRYHPSYFWDHAKLNQEYCWKEYQRHARKIKKREREKWLKNELKNLEFPRSLPKGLCHADLNYSNFLFKNDKIAAVLDFDISFYTYLIYDVASLIYWWAWLPRKSLQEKAAAYIVKEYSRWRPLGIVEKAHIYDALKLIILLGISWSEEKDFESEREKIEFLNATGREGLYHKLFT